MISSKIFPVGLFIRGNTTHHQLRPMSTLFKQATFLGTSSGCPTPFRNVSSSCLHFTDGRIWMFDCGEGTQHQVIRSNHSIPAANPWMATAANFQLSSVSLSKVNRIFVTHLHGDHCYGLPGLMCSLGLAWQAPGVVKDATFFLKKRGVKQQQAAGTKQEDEEAEEEEYGDMVYDHYSKDSQFLELYGPPGLAKYLRAVFRVSEAGFGFQYRVHELVHPTLSHMSSNPSDNLPCEVPTVIHFPVGCEAGIQEEQASESAKVDPAAPPANAIFMDITGETGPAESKVTVHAAYLSHRVTSIGFVMVEPQSAGTLDVQACLRLGVPKGPLLAALKRGEDVVIPSSDPPVTVKASDVLGAATPGRTYIHLGDTSSSENIVTLCAMLSGEDGTPLRPDYLVHESTFDDDTSTLAVPRGHSTSRMAGAFAAELRVKDTLIITHFSARYPPPQPSVDGTETPMEVLTNQAREGLSKRLMVTPSSSSSEQQATAVVVPAVVAAYDFMVFDLSKQRSAAATSQAFSKKVKV